MRPRPAHRLGRPHRARLAAWLAEITGWAELVISPGNLPTSPDLAAGDRGDLSARMQRATDQLHQARMLLERLAADRPQAAPRAGGPMPTARPAVPPSTAEPNRCGTGRALGGTWSCSLPTPTTRSWAAPPATGRHAEAACRR